MAELLSVKGLEGKEFHFSRLLPYDNLPAYCSERPLVSGANQMTTIPTRYTQERIE
jgi:hypothetical protein